MKKILPPYGAMILMGTGFLLHFILMPQPWVSGVWRWFGLLPAVGGLFLLKDAQRHFAKQSNPVRPGEKPVALVTEGPYRWTRNPMYLGITLILYGLALGVGTWPMFLAPVLFPVWVSKVFISMEEALLQKLFGGDYKAFCLRVRRWF